MSIQPHKMTIGKNGENDIISFSFGTIAISQNDNVQRVHTITALWHRKTGWAMFPIVMDHGIEPVGFLIAAGEDTMSPAEFQHLCSLVEFFADDGGSMPTAEWLDDPAYAHIIAAFKPETFPSRTTH